MNKIAACEVQKKMICMKEAPPVVMMPPRPDAPPPAAPPPVPNETPERLPLLISREEADALLTVLLMTAFEDGTFDGAMERILTRLADVQREFSRDRS